MARFSILFIVYALLSIHSVDEVQEIQGKATYYSKSKMDLGSWGARMSEAQKKQIQARLKNRLEKTYTLYFNKTESVFTEDYRLDAVSGATDSWGSNFARGQQYKNIADTSLVQSQEFYGKKFLVKDNLQEFQWVMTKETKRIGNYLCFKAIATVPTNDLNWFNFSWNDLQSTNDNKEIDMTPVEAWYTLQIPIGHGPAEYWGLPGFILEVSSGNTTILCSEVIINPQDKIKIEAPEKGEVVAIDTYRETVKSKMQEMRNGYSRRRN